MGLKRFLFCFNILEGCWLCAVISVLLGVLRILLQCFNLHYRRRLTKIQREDAPISFEVIQTITVLQLASAVMSVFVAVVMMVGLFKRHRRLLLPWMVWIMTEQLCDVIIIIFYASKHVKIQCGVYIADIAAFFITVYSVLCVYTLFRDWTPDTREESQPLLSIQNNGGRHNAFQEFEY